MAFLEMTYKSRALKTNITLNVLLPERKDMDDIAGAPEVKSFKTLYLLHGLGANHSDWIRKTSIERYASAHGIAVVMPEVGRTWYTDTAYGQNYFTFITEELPSVCQSYFKGMSDRREDNFIGGFSMGGYGALKAAVSCPERYFACISLSGSLDITREGRPYLLSEWQGNFGFDLPDAAALKGSKHDIYALTEKKHHEGITFPKLYLWCGTEDHLVELNRKYHALLNELHIDHCYEESVGNHTWKYWDQYIQRALDYILTNSEK